MTALNEYQLRRWSVRVRWRDRRCAICQSREQLEAHHIFDKSNHPDMAYNLDNGVALCGDNKKSGNSCHRHFHTVFMGGYQESCNRKDWERFVRMIQFSNAIRSSGAHA